MKVISVVGARPQFIKLAPVAEALSGAGHEHRILHTGQHYDPGMSEAFFDEFELPEPDWNLGVGSGSHGAQTGAMLAGIEDVLEEAAPDWVVVYGDTNSTLAAAVAAVKLLLPVAHVEAGLRSFNRAMPEEHNRVLADHACDLLLAPTQRAVEQLAGEGLASRTVLTGDVMVDVLLRVAGAVPPPADAGRGIVATVHRQENTDDPERLAAVVAALAALPLPVDLPVHPRLAARAQAHGIDLGAGALRPRPPMAYGEMVRAVAASAGVVTDSGGLQKEAFVLRVPCATLRHETEWPETLEGGWNVLVGDLQGLDTAVGREPDPAVDSTPFGTGDAAGRIVRALENCAQPV